MTDGEGTHLNSYEKDTALTNTFNGSCLVAVTIHSLEQIFTQCVPAVITNECRLRDLDPGSSNQVS